MIDVNIRPDKREVLLKNEKQVFAKLKACLFHTYKDVEGRTPQSRLILSTQTQLLPMGMQRDGETRLCPMN